VYHRVVSHRIAYWPDAFVFQTSNTLAFTLHLLSTHPEVQEKLHAEVSRVLGQGTPTPESMEQMSYLKCILKEALRWDSDTSIRYYKVYSIHGSKLRLSVSTRRQPDLPPDKWNCYYLLSGTTWLSQLLFGSADVACFVDNIFWSSLNKGYTNKSCIKVKLPV